jgi:hypothetical protein
LGKAPGQDRGTFIFGINKIGGLIMKKIRVPYVLNQHGGAHIDKKKQARKKACRKFKKERRD